MMLEPVALTDADRADVLALAARAAANDGVAPLSEEHLLAIRVPGASVRMARSGSDLVAVASRVGDAVEIVVDPPQRRRGHGGSLVRAVLEAEPHSAFWAHGDLPAAQATAASTGLTVVRELLHLVRSPAPPPVTDQVALSYADAVAAGTGDLFLANWLALNARAFADHPEQGSWTMADLRARLAEEWFDPALMWLLPAANPASGATGSVWVKPQRDGDEIYVLAVDPTQSGKGLGTGLLAVALTALGSQRSVDLYVDGDNLPARRLYERAGFITQTRDVQYATRT